MAGFGVSDVKVEDEGIGSRVEDRGEVTSPERDLLWTLDNEPDNEPELTLSTFHCCYTRYHPPLGRRSNYPLLSVSYCSPKPRSSLRAPRCTDPLQGEGPEPLGKPGHLGTAQGARPRVERASRGESVGR